MSVQKMLEYQNIDLNIYKKEKIFAQSAEMKRMLQCKEEVKNKRDALDSLTAELDKCYVLLASLENKLEEEENNRSAYETDFEDFSTMADFEKFEKGFAKYEESVINLSKEIQKVIKRISEINELNKKINTQITKFVNQFNSAKALTEDKRIELLREAVPYARQLKELEPQIEVKFLTKYRELRTKKKMPAFVPYSDGNCLGCGIEIKVEVDKLMINQYDCAECPHCGRIVYKMN